MELRLLLKVETDRLKITRKEIASEDNNNKSNNICISTHHLKQKITKHCILSRTSVPWIVAWNVHGHLWSVVKQVYSARFMDRRQVICPTVEIVEHRVKKLKTAMSQNYITAVKLQSEQNKKQLHLFTTEIIELRQDRKDNQ